MAKVVQMYELERLLAFVKLAADLAAKRPKAYSFSGTGEETPETFGGEPKPGDFLALRWGIHERALLIIKLDEDFQPVIFGDAISVPTEEQKEEREKEDNRRRRRALAAVASTYQNSPAYVINAWEEGWKAAREEYDRWPKR